MIVLRAREWSQNSSIWSGSQGRFCENQTEGCCSFALWIYPQFPGTAPYVSRDRIGPIIGPKLQLSQEAQKVLERIISASDSERLSGIQAARGLSSADANAVLQALINRARRAEKYTDEDAPVNVLVSYAQARPDLIVEAVLALGHIPETRLGTGLPARLAILRKLPSAAGVIDEQLRKWAGSSTNPGLATSAGNILKRSQQQ